MAGNVQEMSFQNVVDTVFKPAGIKAGGYPDELFLDLTDTEREDWQCNVCYMVARDARRCDNTHLFCATCVFAWSMTYGANADKCPVCRGKQTHGYTHDNSLNSTLNRRKVRCHHAGCASPTMTLSQFLQHVHGKEFSNEGVDLESLARSQPSPVSAMPRGVMGGTGMLIPMLHQLQTDGTANAPGRSFLQDMMLVLHLEMELRRRAIERFSGEQNEVERNRHMTEVLAIQEQMQEITGFLSLLFAGPHGPRPIRPRPRHVARMDTPLPAGTPYPPPTPHPPADGAPSGSQGRRFLRDDSPEDRSRSVNRLRPVSGSRSLAMTPHPPRQPRSSVRVETENSGSPDVMTASTIQSLGTTAPIPSPRLARRGSSRTASPSNSRAPGGGTQTSRAAGDSLQAADSQSQPTIDWAVSEAPSQVPARGVSEPTSPGVAAQSDGRRQPARARADLNGTRTGAQRTAQASTHVQGGARQQPSPSLQQSNSVARSCQGGPANRDRLSAVTNPRGQPPSTAHIGEPVVPRTEDNPPSVLPAVANAADAPPTHINLISGYHQAGSTRAGNRSARAEGRPPSDLVSSITSMAAANPRRGSVMGSNSGEGHSTTTTGPITTNVSGHTGRTAHSELPPIAATSGAASTGHTPGQTARELHSHGSSQLSTRSGTRAEGPAPTSNPVPSQPASSSRAAASLGASHRRLSRRSTVGRNSLGGVVDQPDGGSAAPAEGGSGAESLAHTGPRRAAAPGLATPGARRHSDNVNSQNHTARQPFTPAPPPSGERRSSEVTSRPGAGPRTRPTAVNDRQPIPRARRRSEIRQAFMDANKGSGNNG